MEAGGGFYLFIYLFIIIIIYFPFFLLFFCGGALSHVFFLVYRLMGLELAGLKSSSLFIFGNYFKGS